MYVIFLWTVVPNSCARAPPPPSFRDTPSLKLVADFGVWFPRWIFWWIFFFCIFPWRNKQERIHRKIHQKIHDIQGNLLTKIHWGTILSDLQTHNRLCTAGRLSGAKWRRSKTPKFVASHRRKTSHIKNKHSPKKCTLSLGMTAVWPTILAEIITK